MARSNFTPGSFLIRLLFAAVLVLVTYNPIDPWSFYHWAIEPFLNRPGDFTILKGIASIALLIAWGVFLGATYKAIGMIGTVLLATLFGLGIWWFIDVGLISLDKPDTLTWLILVALIALLSVGISWSHLRRRLTGQVDVDDPDT
ncbi:MAG: hypothetical protein KTR18_12030 [Acidiferrobacterales bacterium]|nr:hypothetical protein [Acidiferrobacterales bacterium]